MLDIFVIASFIGTVAFALSGFLIGASKKMDWMGVFILAMLTANGGGVIRDVLVNQTPKLLTDLSGFFIVVVVFIVALVFKLGRSAKIEKSRLFVLSDALGLVAFSMTGALVGVEAELNAFGVVVLAFITAAGGGIIRDVLVNEVPALFSSDFYGSVAILAGLGVYFLHYFNVANNLTLAALLAGALALRLCAYVFKWKLPRISGN
ncbi:MAG: TRIC cation channel family protein [Rickettsiales bacterium]|nr:TRIC cation channel family protein [Rickettsiales bacterium]